MELLIGAAVVARETKQDRAGHHQMLPLEEKWESWCAGEMGGVGLIEGAKGDSNVHM